MRFGFGGVGGVFYEFMMMYTRDGIGKRYDDGFFCAYDIFFSYH